MNFIARLLCKHRYEHDSIVPLLGNTVIIYKCRNCGKKRKQSSHISEDKTFDNNAGYDSYIDWNKLKGGK